MKNIIHFAISFLFISPGENKNMDDVGIYIASSIRGIYHSPWLSILALIPNLLLINISNKILEKRFSIPSVIND